MEASNSNGNQPQLSTPPLSQDLTPVQQQSPAQTPVQVQLPAKTPVQVQFPAQAPCTSASSSKSQPDHVLYKNGLQDVARLAMMNITKRIKDVEVPREVFCNSILNEYAVKRVLEKPIYNTVQTPWLLPAFISALVFNGVSYTRNVGKSKKEAKQLAGRVVIQSLKGTVFAI